MTSTQSPESLILTRLYAAQRRLRFTRSVRAGLVWFAWGALLASAGLILLWNWNRLPGPWQWLAAAGRPGELLWLPLLTGLGGFGSRWLVLPGARPTAYRMDQLLDGQECLLTAADWILSEKPRTRTSERVLAQAAALVEDEESFTARLSGLEPTSWTSYALLATLLAPLTLLVLLPPHVGMPRNTAVWLGEEQVDRLTEELLKELENTDFRGRPGKRLEELLKELEGRPGEPTAEEGRELQRELQRALDQVVQQARTQEQARELLQTLAQRAREGREFSEPDESALETLKRNLATQGQQERLDQAAEAWKSGRFGEAADTLESLQREAGQTARELSEEAARASEQQQLETARGEQFDEARGDQFDSRGFHQGDGQGSGPTSSQGDGPGSEQGQGQGQGSDAGSGTTLSDQGDSTGAGGYQSLRRAESESEWVEEYQHLHPPERTEYQKAQTRVQGQLGDEGPRFRTSQEGLGSVTEPSGRSGSGGLLEYREEAENAILREEVPADYRENVRLYFESLEDIESGAP